MDGNVNSISFWDTTGGKELYNLSLGVQGIRPLSKKPYNFLHNYICVPIADTLEFLHENCYLPLKTEYTNRIFRSLDFYLSLFPPSNFYNNHKNWIILASLIGCVSIIYFSFSGIAYAVNWENELRAAEGLPLLTLENVLNRKYFKDYLIFPAYVEKNPGLSNLIGISCLGVEVSIFLAIFIIPYLISRLDIVENIAKSTLFQRLCANSNLFFSSAIELFLFGPIYLIAGIAEWFFTTAWQWLYPPEYTFANVKENLVPPTIYNPYTKKETKIAPLEINKLGSMPLGKIIQYLDPDDRVEILCVKFFVELPLIALFPSYFGNSQGVRFDVPGRETKCHKWSFQVIFQMRQLFKYEKLEDRPWNNFLEYEETARMSEKLCRIRADIIEDIRRMRNYTSVSGGELEDFHFWCYVNNSTRGNHVANAHPLSTYPK